MTNDETKVRDDLDTILSFRKSADGKWRLLRDANLIGGTAG